MNRRYPPGDPIPHEEGYTSAYSRGWMWIRPGADGTLELYGNRVELHGINRLPDHGTQDQMEKAAVKTGILSESELDGLATPQIHHMDVDAGLEFDNCFFDVVFSQVAFFFFENKTLFIEEVSRILKPGGIALIDVWLKRKHIPPAHRECMIIHSGDTAVSLWDYIERLTFCRKRDLSINRTRRRLQKWFGVRKKRPSRKSCLEISHDDNPSMFLQQVKSVDLSQVNPDWCGRQSFYRVKGPGST
jgi:SAM-dependent methyltransferase